MNFLELFTNKTIYHVSDSDLDGISCRIIAEYFIKPICKKYIPFNTSDRSLPDFDWNVMSESDIVIFTDIAPSDLEMVNKIKLEKDLYIFDHHISSRSQLGDFENYHFDETKCGTKLFFDNVTNNVRLKKSIFQFVELVNTYDLYQVNSSLWRNAKALNNILYSYVDWKYASDTPDTHKYNRFIDMQLRKFDDQRVKNYYFTGMETQNALKAEKKEKTNYDEAKRNLQFRVDNSNNKFMYTECVSKVSWVSSLILREFSDYQYLAIRGTWDKKSKKVSLRSNNGFDVSLIAEKWGGGGHLAASAFEFKDDDSFDKFKNGEISLI